MTEKTLAQSHTFSTQDTARRHGARRSDYCQFSTFCPNCEDAWTGSRRPLRSIHRPCDNSRISLRRWSTPGSISANGESQIPLPNFTLKVSHPILDFSVSTFTHISCRIPIFCSRTWRFWRNIYQVILRTWASSIRLYLPNCRRVSSTKRSRKRNDRRIDRNYNSTAYRYSIYGGHRYRT